MTSKICQSEYHLRALRPEYKRKESQLFSELLRQLDASCFVSFSAGKDSAVIAHAARTVIPNINILMVDPGVPYHWTQDDRDKWTRYAEWKKWNLRMFPWDKWGSPLPTEGGQEYRDVVHRSMFRDLTDWALSRGLTRRVMGLRRAESRNRRHVKALTTNTICPIVEWTSADVWTYIVHHGLPWLSIYDHLGPDARNGLIGLNAREQGRLVWLRHNYPQAYLTAKRVLGEAIQ